MLPPLRQQLRQQARQRSMQLLLPRLRLLWPAALLPARQRSVPLSWRPVLRVQRSLVLLRRRLRRLRRRPRRLRVVLPSRVRWLWHVLFDFVGLLV